jgi:hypothetical protein
LLRLRLAVTGPAIALVAIAGGLAGTWPAGTAQTAAAGRAVQVTAATGASHSISLDAFASASAGRPQVSGNGSVSGSGKAHHKATARSIARHMLRHFRWSPRHQFRYLNRLWNRESGWNVFAFNPYSAAYGIPQAVPGSKMATAGPRWRSSARTQIRWGLRYIRSRYGSPRQAWIHETSVGWY